MFDQKSLNILFGHIWIVELTYTADKLNLKKMYLYMLTGGKFATGVVDDGGAP
jgi:hypothetical protein